MWYNIFIVKFEMSICDAVGAIFISHLTNVSIEHSLNTTTKGLSNSGKWHLITRSGNDLSRNILLYHFVRLMSNIYHKVVFRPDIFNPDHTCSSNVEIVVWARLLKQADFNVSTSQWSSHMSQCLRNNEVTRWRHTLVHFTAQIPLRMHKPESTGKSMEQP